VFDFVRVNTDWLWDNFPNERRFASMIFTAENILEPKVIQTIYKVRKSVEELVTPGRFATYILVILITMKIDYLLKTK